LWRPRPQLGQGRRIAVAYWACAQVEPRQEQAAQHFLGLNGFEIYCPRLRAVRRSHGRRIETRPCLFPSYVFVAIVAGWWSARWCPHVVRLILNGVTPAVVSDQIIDDLRRRECNGLIELPKRPPLKAGDQVRILQGPFAGHLAIFADMKPHQRVEILLQLGGEQRVTLAKKDIEVVR